MFAHSYMIFYYVCGKLEETKNRQQKNRKFLGIWKGFRILSQVVGNGLIEKVSHG